MGGSSPPLGYVTACMELKSGRVYCKMAHNKQVFSEDFASLTDLYKKAGDFMNDVSNAAELKCVLANVDFAYEHLSFLSSCLSDTDLVPGTSTTRDDFGNECLSFKTWVQQ